MNNLQKYRTWKGLKQSEVAIIAGISKNTYQKVEANQALMNTEAIVKLCNYYKISIYQLYDRQSIQKKINELKVKKEREERTTNNNKIAN
jgi:DNA-binding XRE family transcriptional regulator